MRLPRILLVVGAVAAIAVPVTPVSARADDYAGKTIRILVAASAGGGYDREARLLARHLPRHLSGAPRIVVDNVPGAGGLIAANMLARTTAPDGLTIGYFPFGVLSAQFTGNPAIRYDVRRFQILGSPYPDRTVCVFPVSTGITSMERWMTSARTLKLGSTGRDSIMHVFPSLLKDALGLKAQIINGYKGTTEVRLAIASGELDGACLGWGGVKSGWPDRRGIAVVVQSGNAPHRELPDVPLAVSFGKGAEAEALLGATTATMSLAARFYAFPPGTSRALHDRMSAAMIATAQDAGFTREAEAAGISNEPVPGEEVRSRVDALFSLAPDLIAHVRRAIAD